MAVLTHPAPRTQSTAGRPDTRRVRILFVEDDPDTSMAMARLLTCSGHEVRTAASVAEAISTWRGEEFDLLITDIGLPDGSGLTLMRALTGPDPMRAIVISGFGLAEDIRESQDAGFAEHLVKPVSFSALQASIRRVMDLNRLQLLRPQAV